MQYYKPILGHYFATGIYLDNSLHSRIEIILNKRFLMKSHIL